MITEVLNKIRKLILRAGRGDKTEIKYKIDQSPFFI